MKRALLLSGYDAASHQRWHSALRAQQDDFAWTLIAQPARHFAWRARANAMAIAQDARLEEGGPYSLILATSATDLVTLRGLRPELHEAQAILYFHENQFAYPWRPEAQPNALHLRFQQILCALCAERLVFNSRHNRDTFIEGARALLERMPDGVPAGTVAELEAKSSVLPVGVDDALFVLELAPAEPSAPLEIVWNHRWEYDKAPGVALGAIELLLSRDPKVADALRLHVVGQRFRAAPPAFERLRPKLAGVIGTWGHLARRRDYVTLLSLCDVVLTSALHEFQGLSVIEAMAAGCQPIAPDRLAYREYVPRHQRYPSSPQDPEAEMRAIAERVAALVAARHERGGALARQAARPYQWSRLEARWRALFVEVTHST